MWVYKEGRRRRKRKICNYLPRCGFSTPSKTLEGKVLDFRTVLIFVSQLVCATSPQTNLAWPYVWQPCRILSQRAPSSISWWLMEAGSWEPSSPGAPSSCTPRLQGMDAGAFLMRSIIPLYPQAPPGVAQSRADGHLCNCGIFPIMASSSLRGHPRPFKGGDSKQKNKAAVWKGSW